MSSSELEEGEIEESDEYVQRKRRGKTTNSISQLKKKSKYSSHLTDEDIFSSLKKKETDDILGKKCVIKRKRFQWSALKILLVGDERAASFKWTEYKDFPMQEIYSIPQCNLESLCSLTEKFLHRDYDIAFLMSFHYDFVHNDVNSSLKETGSRYPYLMSLRPQINISELMKTVKRYHQKWSRQYPRTKIIWSLPYPPNFYKYNCNLLRTKGMRITNKYISKYSEHDNSKDYYDLTRRFEKDWRERLEDIPLFPLHKVLFLHKPNYKKSFSKNTSPKFPSGYLSDGLSATKLMTVYFAYLFVEFIIDKDFYPGISEGLDIEETERKLLETDSDSQEETDIVGHYKRHSRHKEELHKRPKSRSSRESSRPLSRTSDKAKSAFLSQPKEASQKTHSLPEVKNTSLLVSSASDPIYIESDSSEASPIAKKEKGSNQSQIKDETSFEKEVTKEEVSFWNTLKYLREIHDVQCSVFRRKPHTHPRYKEERDEFMKNAGHILPSRVIEETWNEFWREKLEELFTENWNEKKQELISDLNMKGSFSSLNSEKVDESSTLAASNKVGSNHNVKHQSVDSHDSLSFLTSQLPLPESHSKTDHSKSTSTVFSPSKDEDSSRPDKTKEIPEVINESTCINGDLNSFALGDATQSSDSEHSFLFESDVDVDCLMDNPDFLQGLDDLDKELQSALTENSDDKDCDNAQESNTSNINDLASIFTESGSSSREVYGDDVNNEFVNVLKLLCRVSKPLGHLGATVSTLYLRASEEIESGSKAFSCLNSESRSLLKQVKNKLESFLADNPTEVQKAVYSELLDRLNSLMNNINIPFRKFSKLSIDNIAAATLGEQVSDIVTFIKNALLYHGYDSFTSEDVMNIYMSVKAIQIEAERR